METRLLKTIVFDCLEIVADDNVVTTKQISEIYKYAGGGNSLCWHLYGRRGYFTLPGKEVRYVRKISRGLWKIINHLTRS